MRIVGISAHFHDAACCILEDGKLVSATQEERLSRRKHDPSFPRLALRSCLKDIGATIADIDLVAYYENPQKKLARQIWMCWPEVFRQPGRLRALDATRPEREIREVMGYDGPIEYVDHHESHAASAYYFSGFPEAAILTADGVGEWATTAYAYAVDRTIDTFEEVRFPHSLGLLYSSLTGYLGFSVNDGEYKVMGLAPYGQLRFVDRLRNLVKPSAEGQFELNLSFFDFDRSDRMYSDALIDLLGEPPRKIDEPIRDVHCDLARSLQFVLEEILVEKTNYLQMRTSSRNLCLAGGVALNCVANHRIRSEKCFEQLYVQPAANDAGGALGAAAVAYYRRSGTKASSIAPMRHAYLGPQFETDDIRRVMAAAGVPFEDYGGREEELLEAVCHRLAAGRVVGWFHGRMEFGPRALGARSILADPRRHDMRERMNMIVKKRESFRPFAPAVLEGYAHDHFEIDCPSPFMVETFQVRSALDLPAVTHVDGSARVQTVDGESNPRFARLLRCFYRRTGCPILLNTSFNVQGEPIVCSPTDALLSFCRCDLDCLVLEDLLLDRAGLQENWAALVAGVAEFKSVAVSHSVYSFF